MHEDEIRLSDSLTVEFNTLGPGVIGHVMRNTAWDASTHARTDRWFHYDQVGTVIATTDAGGSAADTNWFDAFGNRLDDWETGLVASGGGWGLQTKRLDPSTQVYYFRGRWGDAAFGTFASPAPLHSWIEHPYNMMESDPVSGFDPEGEAPTYLIERAGRMVPTCLKKFRSVGRRGGNRAYTTATGSGAKAGANAESSIAYGKDNVLHHSGTDHAGSRGSHFQSRDGKPRGHTYYGKTSDFMREHFTPVALVCLVGVGQATAESVDQQIVAPTVARGRGRSLGDVRFAGNGWGNAAYGLVPFQ